MAEEGLRQRKRRRTRAAIADAAMQLFFARGFDQVTVVDIAAAADVAEKTVYNHFPVKAELVFDAGDEMLEELLAAVDGRAAGVPVLAGVRNFLDRRDERIARQSPPRPNRRFLELIAASSTLQAYRREMFARWETSLAEVLARDTNSPPGAAEPFVVAAAVVAVLRAGLEPPASGGTPVQHNSVAALDLLADGIAEYAPRRPDPTSEPPSEQVHPQGGDDRDH